MLSIKNFCKTKDMNIYDKLAVKVRNVFIEKSFQILYQGSGDLQFAREILLHEDMIKILIDKETLGAKNDIICLTDKGKAYGQNLTQSKKLPVLGVAVYDVFEEKELENVEKDFDEAYLSFPEYRRNPDNLSLGIDGKPICYVVGGFAAAGNPGSFHNPFVRNLRIKSTKAIKEKILLPMKDDLSSWTLEFNLQLATMPDRMMRRPPYMTPTPEAWHRDVADIGANVSDDGVILGGWVNTSKHTQKFSTIAGSHLGVRFSHLERGFAEPGHSIESKIKNLEKSRKSLEKDSEEYTTLTEEIKSLKTQLQQMRKILSENKTIFEIPPGHAISFPQYILHEIVANPVDHWIKRVFIGYSIDVLSRPVWDISKRLKEQAILPLGSGQEPPMYSKSHLSYYQTKAFYLFGSKNPLYGKNGSDPIEKNLSEWSVDTFVPECLDPKRAEAGKSPLVYRFLPSLKTMNLMVYPEYSEEELSIYKPTQLYPLNFEIEDIVDTKFEDEKLYLRIKWKNYPSEENTWETIDDLIFDGHQNIFPILEERYPIVAKKIKKTKTKKKEQVKIKFTKTKSGNIVAEEENYNFVFKVKGNFLELHNADRYGEGGRCTKVLTEAISKIIEMHKNIKYLQLVLASNNPVAGYFCYKNAALANNFKLVETIKGENERNGVWINEYKDFLKDKHNIVNLNRIRYDNLRQYIEYENGKIYEDVVKHSSKEKWRPGVEAGQALFASSDPSDFSIHLFLYDTVISHLASEYKPPKKRKSGDANTRWGEKPVVMENLVENDLWWRETLPELLKERGYMNKNDMRTLLAWKWGRGQFRPGRTKFEKNNTDKSVVDATKACLKAAAPLGEDLHNDKIINETIKSAVKAATVLSQVGPATVTAILAAQFPETCPFYSDEAMESVGMYREPYTLSRYLQFAQALREKAAELGEDWTAEKVGRALWAASKARAIGLTLGPDFSSESEIEQISEDELSDDDLFDD